MEEDKQQDYSKVPKHLQAHVFKKGQSGNPNGRPQGSLSLKHYAKLMIEQMDDDQRQEYLAGLPKDFIWQMAEGKAKQDVDVDHSGGIVIAFDPSFNVTPPTPTTDSE
jgi:hypothetical protein